MADASIQIEFRLVGALRATMRVIEIAWECADAMPDWQAVEREKFKAELVKLADEILAEMNPKPRQSP